MPKIFISYRRMDSQERAHRIADWLVLKFGIENVFIDVDHLGGGVDFAADINKSLDETDVLLVVIGDKWVDELRRRMESSAEQDLVRLEVVKGLKDVPLLIPVLLSEDVQIDASRLPEDVRPIVKRNYRYVRLKDFHQDMERLRSEIAAQFPDESKTIRAYRQRIWAISSVAVLLLILSAALLFTIGQDYLKQLSYTPTAENLDTEIALLVAASSVPTNTPTADITGTISVRLTEYFYTAEAEKETAIAAYTATPTVTLTPTDTASPTPNATETALAAQMATDERSTQIAQAAANAPTNTPRPSNTPTATRTNTPIPTATATANQTSTRQAYLHATQTENAFSTQAYQTVQAEIVAQNTERAGTAVAVRDAQATENAHNSQATRTQQAQRQATGTAYAQQIRGTSTAQAIDNRQATGTAYAQQIRGTSTARAIDNRQSTATQYVRNIRGTATQQALSSQTVNSRQVTVAGSFQDEIGCSNDWMPECSLTVMSDPNRNGVYTWTTTDIPAGDWEVKVTIGGTWDENYGRNGIAGGDNIPFSVSRNNQEVTFTYSPWTHILTVLTGDNSASRNATATQYVAELWGTATQRAFAMDVIDSRLVTVAGSFQDEIGCSNDWMPECFLTLMSDPDRNGIYTWTTRAIPAGDWEVKVTIGGSWDENYGLYGEAGGANIPFTVRRSNQEVTFTYSPWTHTLTVESD